VAIQVAPAEQAVTGIQREGSARKNMRKGKFNLVILLPIDRRPLKSLSCKIQMIPSKIIGKTSGANWIGLIDSIYGIILTLLVIELPVIMLKLMYKSIGNSHSAVSFAVLIAIGVRIIGYFAIFTIIYDIWSYHKTLLHDAKRLRVFAVCTGWILFMSSLAPAFFYLADHFAIEEVLNEGRHLILLNYSRICLFAFIAIIYLLLAALAKSEKRQSGQTSEKRGELEFIFGTSLTKALITVLIAAITTSPFSYLPSPIGITVIALITYFPINFFKKRDRR
jgi:uncharacterized membrane protein